MSTKAILLAIAIGLVVGGIGYPIVHSILVRRSDRLFERDLFSTVAPTNLCVAIVCAALAAVFVYAAFQY